MDYSRRIQNDNSQGGASKVYVMPFVNYLDSQITVVNNILTVFPYNIIYDMNATNINYTVDVNDDLYDEKLSFQIKKLLETDNFSDFIKQDYRIIIKDNNNNIRLFGLKNGMIGSYKEEIGTNRNEFNGYSFSFQNKEEQSAPYLKDLSGFLIIPVPTCDITVNTYADLLALPTPTETTNIRVLVDEDKGLENTYYIYNTDGQIIWVAVTDDN